MSYRTTHDGCRSRQELCACRININASRGWYGGKATDVVDVYIHTIIYTCFKYTQVYNRLSHIYCGFSHVPHKYLPQTKYAKY